MRPNRSKYSTESQQTIKINDVHSLPDKIHENDNDTEKWSTPNPRRIPCGEKVMEAEIGWMIYDFCPRS